jgi:hypothetical protein
MPQQLGYDDHPCETITDQWMTSLSPTEQLGYYQKRQDLRRQKCH